MSGNTKTFGGSFLFFLKIQAIETVEEPREAAHEGSPLHLSAEICSQNSAWRGVLATGCHFRLNLQVTLIYRSMA